MRQKLPLAIAIVTLAGFFGATLLYHFGFFDPRYRPTSYPSLHQPHSPILILQHAVPQSGPGELVHASVEGHQRYAGAHGYKYVVDHTDYMGTRDPSAASMNKVYLLLRVALAELAEGTVKWIMMADADTLIADPSLSIEVALANAVSHSDPRFNAGVLLFHVEQDLITLLSSVITCAAEHRARGEFYSDQLCFADVLRSQKRISERFYEVPQHWWNGFCGELYHLDEITNDCTVIREAKPPALHVHFVAGQKKTVDWKQTVDFAEGIWRQMIDGTLNNTRSREARALSTEWWLSARNGIDTMTWSRM